MSWPYSRWKRRYLNLSLFSNGIFIDWGCFKSPSFFIYKKTLILVIFMGVNLDLGWDNSDWSFLLHCGDLEVEANGSLSCLNLLCLLILIRDNCLNNNIFISSLEQLGYRCRWPLHQWPKKVRGIESHHESMHYKQQMSFLHVSDLISKLSDESIECFFLPLHESKKHYRWWPRAHILNNAKLKLLCELSKEADPEWL